MKPVYTLIILLLLNGCASKLLKKAPVLAPHKTFYKFEKEVGTVFHNKCKKKDGEDRKCTKTEFTIEEMWGTFYPGFIIIPEHMVF